MLISLLIQFVLCLTCIEHVHCNDDCVDFNVGIYTGNESTTEKGFLYCVLTLPCKGRSVIKVEAIEIYRAPHELLARLDSNRCEVSEVPGLKVGNEIVLLQNEGVSYMSVEFFLNEMKPDYDFQCVVRLVGSNGSLFSINVSTTLHIVKSYDKLKALQSSFKDLLFNQEPVTFQQHKYYLGHTNSVKSVEAINFCAILGGYLVEVNGADELMSIEKYLADFNLTQPILIGGTRAEKEAQWIFQRSGKAIEFFRWLQEDLVDTKGIDKCLSLVTLSEGAYMKSISCVERQHQRYLCEVE